MAKDVGVSGGGGGGHSQAHDHTTADGSGVLTNSEFDGFLDGVESTAPSTPAANHFRVWIEDKNGISHLMMMNSDGLPHILGQDGRTRVRNTTASIITAGQIVYVTGATGNVPNVGLAKANSATTLPAIGFADADIAVNGYGMAHIEGVNTPIVTTGYTAGQTLYVSAATAGAITNVKPVAPNFIQPVGVVLTVGVNGEVLVIKDAVVPQAADIINTPAGTVAAVSVQAAINELDTEKLATATNVQVFAASGSVQTWNKPTGAKWVEVLLIGGGGGGGGGGSQVNANNSGGGGGGGGGAMVHGFTDPGLLNASENVWAGIAGPGGPGATVDGTNRSGTIGTDGGLSSFGDFLAPGGGGGGAGSSAGGGSGPTNSIEGTVAMGLGLGMQNGYGAPGVAGGSTAAVAATSDIPTSTASGHRNGAGGGGGGGGRTAAGGTVRAGGDTGVFWKTAGLAGGAAAAAGTGPFNGQPGTAYTKMYTAGGGGSGGGGGQGSGQAGNGGAGANYGGGGGGGGGCQATSAKATAGNGGDGGPGIAVIVTYL